MEDKSSGNHMRKRTHLGWGRLGGHKLCFFNYFFIRWRKIFVFMILVTIIFSATSGYSSISFTEGLTVLEEGDEPVFDEITFQFTAGWNYLTLPVDNNLTAQSLMDLMGCCTIMLDWNGVTQSFVVHVDNLLGNDFPILNGHSYIFFITENCTFTVEGSPVDTVSIPLFHQWGVLGWPFNYSTTAESVGNSIPGCTLVIIFDPNIQYYKTHVVGKPWNNFPIEKGTCFEVYVTMDSYWNEQG